MNAPLRAVRGVAAGLALATFGACAVPSRYAGTGVLMISGQESLLAPISVSVVSCRLAVGSAPIAPDSVEPPRGQDTGAMGGLGTHEEAAEAVRYTVVSIGSHCPIVEPTWNGEIRDPLSTPCMLDFAEGRRTIHLTRASFRYAESGRYVDASHAEVELGGDDVESGKYVLFRFAGSAVDARPDRSVCAEETSPP